MKVFAETGVHRLPNTIRRANNGSLDETVVTLRCVNIKQNDNHG